MVVEFSNSDPVTITGIGGRYPESCNVEEFWSNLLSGRELCTSDDRRWPVGFMKLPHKSGKIPSIEKFDADFFGLTNREGNEMDPQHKLCHETTFESILDAGLDPANLADSRTGMFIGQCYNDSLTAQIEDAALYDSQWIENFSQVSKSFSFKGPCMTYDSACASSFSAFNEAVKQIQSGVIDTAIVAGVAVSMSPYTASCFRQLGMTSSDGTSRCMDRNAGGYVRSETICSLVLQRKSASKRIYSIVLNTRTNSDGYKKEGITFPGYDSMVRLMEETYQEIGLDPKETKYIEAHVTGTQAGDPVECGAIEKVFCPDERTEPVLLGCLKSNMGHAEGGSGAAAITKACLIMQKKIIPPNILYTEPNPNIPGLLNGKLKPVLQKQPFEESIISLNSFGFGGTNIHAIIKSYDEIRNKNVHNLSGMNGLNRLILFKARTDDSFKNLRRKLVEDKHEITTEFLDFLDNISRLDKKWKLPVRGYFILDEDKNIVACNWARIDETSSEEITWNDCNNNQVVHELLDIVNVKNVANPNISKQTPTDEVLKFIGKLYMKGNDEISLRKLYPRIKYPVSRTTGSVSQFMSWNHEKDWIVYKVPDYFRLTLRSKRFNFDYSGHHHYLDGHKIDGRIILPASQYLWCIWQSLAMQFIEHNPMVYLKTGVKFWKVKLNRAILVERGEEVNLMTSLNTTTGFFEITQNESCLVSGFACLTYDEETVPSLENQEFDNEEGMISQREFYKELRVRGYDYDGDFQGVTECKMNGSGGNVSFVRNWVTFADAVFQLTLINDPSRQLLLPTGFEFVQVDARAFRDISVADYELFKTILKSSAVERNEEEDISEESSESSSDGGAPVFKVIVSKETQEVSTHGLYIKGMNATPAPRKKATPTVRVIKFCPFNESCEDDPQEKSDYSDKCLTLIRGGKVESDSNNNEVEFNETEENDHSLLSVLQELTTDGVSVVSGDLEQYSAKLSNDLMLKLPLDHDMVHHQLDIVTETFITQNLTVTEVNMSTKSSVEEKMIALLSGKCQGSSYNLYTDEACETLKNQSKTVDNYLSLKTIIGSQLVIIQHPSLGFSFLNSSAQDNKKVSKVIQFTFDQLSIGSFVLVFARTQVTKIENALSNDQTNEANFDEISSAISNFGLVIISTKQIGFHVSILARKVEQIEQPETFEIDSFTYDWVEELKDRKFIKYDEATTPSDAKPIWVVCHSPNGTSGLHGFINCIRHEDKRFNGIAIMDKSCDEGSVIQQSIKTGLKMTIFKDGALGTMKYNPILTSGESVTRPTKTSALSSVNRSGNTDQESFCLEVETKGDLSSLAYHKTRLNKSNTICNVHYSALNFKDVMVASGRIPTTAYPAYMRKINTSDLGMEFSGTNIKGERVMGLVATGAMATHVDGGKIGQNFMFKVPDWMTLEEAATIPVVYFTAYYSLIMRGKLFPGESVLIHAGSGGVGQAAINIALSMGCTVYTTVGTESKRQFIRNQYPSITDDQIFDSRSVSFGDDILRTTDGRGVDVILNSLAEEKLQVGLTCLAENGRFLEIGKYDFMANSMIDPVNFTRNQSFQSICVAFLITKCAEYKEGVHPEVQMLRSLMEEGIKNGVVKPLTRHVFECNQTEEAFRFMATGKHMGKVLINMTGIQQNYNQTFDEKTSIPNLSNARERVSFDPTKSYIVIGGLGGIGLEICDWLIRKGTRNLIIISRTGIKTNYHKFFLNRLKSEFEANIQVKTYDISDRNQSKNLLTYATSFGPVGGIFNVAMVLKDALFEDQTCETFEECCKVKIKGSFNLDQLSRTMCPSLDHFVCFSSLVSTFGNAGQSNYGFANGFMDNLCSKRRSEGLPGLSIGWGAVGDVGHVAENMGNDIVVAGSIPQRINSCLDVLEKVLYSEEAIIGSFVPVDRSNFEVTGDILSSILNILGIKDHSKIDMKSNLGDLGLDSLMAVEIKQILEKKYDKILSTKEIRELSIGEIKAMSLTPTKGST